MECGRVKAVVEEKSYSEFQERRKEMLKKVIDRIEDYINENISNIVDALAEKTLSDHPTSHPTSIEEVASTLAEGFVFELWDDPAETWEITDYQPVDFRVVEKRFIVILKNPADHTIEARAYLGRTVRKENADKYLCWKDKLKEVIEKLRLKRENEKLREEVEKLRDVVKELESEIESLKTQLQACPEEQEDEDPDP